MNFLAWLLLSLLSAAGLASFASQISENKILSLLFAGTAVLLGFFSTWGARSNLQRPSSEMAKEAPAYFQISILGAGLFLSQLAYDPQWRNIFTGAAFACSLLGPLAIFQAKKIREIQYDPIADFKE